MYYGTPTSNDYGDVQRRYQHNPYGSSIHGWGDDDDDSVGKTTTTTTTTTNVPTNNNNNNNNTINDMNASPLSSPSASPSSSSMQSGTTAANPSMSTTTVIVENTTRPADWALTIPIALLFPLFVVKTAEAIMPVKSCVNALVSDWDSCDAEVQKNADIQYFLVLIFGIIGLIVSLVMTRYRISSRPALLGLSYGSMLCLLYAVFTNTHRTNSTIQIPILGIILVGFIFLPRVGGSLMGA
jgi:hypothetical protein